MITIEYELLSDAVSLTIKGADKDQGNTLAARGYLQTAASYTETGWHNRIDGRERGEAEARWLKSAFPTAKLARLPSLGGGIA